MQNHGARQEFHERQEEGKHRTANCLMESATWVLNVIHVLIFYQPEKNNLTERFVASSEFAEL